MAEHGPTTHPARSGTDPDSFSTNANALDRLIDRLHAAIDLEALVAPRFFDISLSSIAHETADAWASCETSAMHFLSRAHLHPAHALAAEHLLDVLHDRGCDRERLCAAPVALLSAAGRLAGQEDIESIVLVRQLSHLAGLLRAVVEEAARSFEADPDPEQPAAPILHA
ncbi:hypothetical protein [Roseivivax isoporae]|uniref:Uncharacterized protein n=1 Tax=Roseivivax isoporae LMG 25204 TaxID=1449351 RepID=X7F8N4_9RHOB|nr:hypothetical protein [Roseivivax isoporae]ETX28451.1 hypothetical protein RISW2_06635 [Roseivivax isoporae LMG 25204]